MTYPLREVTADDWPLWRDVRLAALAEAPHAFKSRLSEWQRAGEERWRARLTIPGAYDVVALLDGQGVGQVTGIPAQDGASWTLISLWVSPRARGHGVGDQLIAAVEARARQSGARGLELSVIPGNSPALALYRRRGFRPAGRPGELLADGVTRELLLAKELPAAPPSPPER